MRVWAAVQPPAGSPLRVGWLARRMEPQPGQVPRRVEMTALEQKALRSLAVRRTIPEQMVLSWQVVAITTLEQPVLSWQVVALTTPEQRV